MCVCVCVCVCVQCGVQGIQYCVYKYLKKNYTCIFVDLVKHGVLTLVSEMWCGRNDRY